LAISWENSNSVARSKGPTRPPTILDVAAAASVSRSTVSLVLRESPLIPKETADRVREAASRVGYVYNRRAAELRSKSSNTIGVVINDLLNPLFAEVLVGLERKLVDAGYVVMMAHTNEDPKRQEQVLRTMQEQRTAGIALCPALGTPAPQLATVKSWGIPLVVLVRYLGPGSYDFAGSNNALGFELATDHLVSQGHRRIGFLCGQPGPTLEYRLEGYRAALRKAGIAFDANLVITANPTRLGGYETMKTLLDMRPRLKAAVCFNDLAAFGALSALGERGLRAGTNFSLMGFDNVLDAAVSNPPLSTVDVRPGEIGEHAASILLTRIAHPGRAKQQYYAMPSLVLRQSS
jgi:LacI family transcriptional regulator